MNVEDVLRETHNDTVRALVRALDLHGPGEGGHAERVAVYAVATGEKLGLDDDQLLILRRAAVLHDVGKIAVDRRLLTKLGGLSEEEFDEIRLHAKLAEEIIESLTWLRPALPAIRHHHERWDGGGYPDGLSGEDIPLAARIIAVAETFDHLTTCTGWRHQMSEVEAIAEVERSSGTQFDPEVVKAFVSVQNLIQPILPR